MAIDDFRLDKVIGGNQKKGLRLCMYSVGRVTARVADVKQPKWCKFVSIVFIAEHLCQYECRPGRKFSKTIINDPDYKDA